MNVNVDNTLAQRANTHGNFRDNSAISQKIKQIIFTSPNAAAFLPEQAEALDMIAHKIARICCGDFNEVDHWLDISGYSTLVCKSLTEVKNLPL